MAQNFKVLIFSSDIVNLFEIFKSCLQQCARFFLAEFINTPSVDKYIHEFFFPAVKSGFEIFLALIYFDFFAPRQYFNRNKHRTNITCSHKICESFFLDNLSPQ